MRRAAGWSRGRDDGDDEEEEHEEQTHDSGSEPQRAVVRAKRRAVGQSRGEPELSHNPFASVSFTAPPGGGAAPAPAPASFGLPHFSNAPSSSAPLGFGGSGAAWAPAPSPPPASGAAPPSPAVSTVEVQLRVLNSKFAAWVAKAASSEESAGAAWTPALQRYMDAVGELERAAAQPGGTSGAASNVKREAGATLHTGGPLGALVPPAATADHPPPGFNLAGVPPVVGGTHVPTSGAVPAPASFGFGFGAGSGSSRSTSSSASTAALVAAPVAAPLHAAPSVPLAAAPVAPSGFGVSLSSLTSAGGAPPAAAPASGFGFGGSSTAGGSSTTTTSFPSFTAPSAPVASFGGASIEAAPAFTFGSAPVPPAAAATTTAGGAGGAPAPAGVFGFGGPTPSFSFTTAPKAPEAATKLTPAPAPAPAPFNFTAPSYAAVPTAPSGEGVVVGGGEGGADGEGEEDGDEGVVLESTASVVSKLCLPDERVVLEVTPAKCKRWDGKSTPKAWRDLDRGVLRLVVNAVSGKARAVFSPEGVPRALVNAALNSQAKVEALGLTGKTMQVQLTAVATTPDALHDASLMRMVFTVKPGDEAGLITALKTYCK